MPSRREFMRSVGGATIGVPLFSHQSSPADYKINLYQSTRVADEIPTGQNTYQPSITAEKWLRSTMRACSANASITIVRDPISIDAENPQDLLETWKNKVNRRSDKAEDSNVLIDISAQTTSLGRAFVGGNAAVSFGGPRIAGQENPTLWEPRTTSAAAVVHEVLHNLGFDHSDGAAYKMETGGLGISGDQEDYPLYLSSVMLASYALEELDSGETDGSPELDNHERLWVSPMPSDKVAEVLADGDYGNVFFAETPHRQCEISQDEATLFNRRSDAPQDRDVDGTYETLPSCQTTPFQVVRLISSVGGGPAQTPVGRRGLDLTGDDEVTVDDILQYLKNEYTD